MTALLPGPVVASGGGALPPLLAAATDAASRATLAMAAAACGWPAPEVHEGGLDTALDLVARATGPQFLIIDLSGLAAPLPAVDALADGCPAASRVIAIGSVNDVGLYRGLRAIGVLDYLVKPLDEATVRQALAAALAGPLAAVTLPAQASPEGRVTAFVGARGGAGTSAVVLALAHLFVRRGRRVLVHDHDCEGGTLALDSDSPPSTALVPLLKAPDRVDRAALEAAIRPHRLGFGLVAAEEPLGQPLSFKPDASLALLKALAELGDHVLVDLPRRLDRPVRAILRTADRVVIVTPRTLAGLRETRRLKMLLDGLRAGQPPLVVVNRAGEPGASVDAELFATAVGGVDAVLPHVPRRAAAAAGTGGTLIDGPGARGVTSGLELLATALDAAHGSAARRPWWQRLPWRPSADG